MPRLVIHSLHPRRLVSLRRPLAVVLVGVLVSAACGDAASPAPTTAAPASPAPTLTPGPAACPSSSPPPAATGWWLDRVFYEVFVRSFADSDGDGIGDLAGLTARLDYLNDGDPSSGEDLGVTALWLMPVAQSPSYHGYDVVDYLAVEEDYGTNDDFRALVDAAHERGISIIVDLVINHTSREHPWFEEARTAESERSDWYVWADEHPGFGGPGGRKVWHEDGERYYYGYFWEGMPDLNLSNASVTAELDAIARFWVEEMGVDGFRLDAARHLIEDGRTLENTPETRAWLAGFRDRLAAVREDALVLGEVWDATSAASRYITEGALDLVFEFGLASAIVSGVRFGDADSLRTIQAEVTAAYPAGGYATFLTNHDQDRVFDVLGGDVDAAKLAATLLLTSPGVPFLYYGEELGLRGRKPDERIRTPLPWDGSEPGAGFTSGAPWQALAANADTANVAAQIGDPSSLLSHYRSLIGLRNASPILQSGELVPVSTQTRGIYAFLRHAAGESVLVLANLTDEPVDGVALSLDVGPLCGSPTIEALLGESLLDGPVIGPTVTASGGFADWSPVAALPPRGAVVLALSR